MNRWLVWTFSLVLVVGCTSHQNYSPSVPHSEESSGSEFDISARKIDLGDILILSVQPGREFEKDLELTVNLEGEILVPLIGWVDVKGLTTREAAEAVRKRLNRDYLVDPKVTLRLKEAKTRAIVILGQLKKPGTYEFPPNGRMTLMEAVAKAEGFTDIANISAIKVVRTMPGGRQKTIRVNAENIIQGREPDLELQEGDLITIPESLF